MTDGMAEFITAFGSVAAPVAAAVVAGVYTRRQRARQAMLETAKLALERAGFSVEAVREIPTQQSDDVEVPQSYTVSLKGGHGEHVTFKLAWASRDEARGGLRVNGVAAVKRATFVVGREHAVSQLARRIGIKDIEVGDAALDSALTLRGWPVDTVRGLVSAPGVRAALSTLFAHASVQHARLAPRNDAFDNKDAPGALAVSWRLPWSEVEKLVVLSDAARALAAALDDARWSEPVGKPLANAAGAAGPESGTPFGVPGLGR